MNNLLLSEKWRPKNLEDVILLPRIRRVFESGLNQNVILYGHFGSGKTTLARILIGKYSKTNPFLELNSSFYTSIDVLRSKIDDFCSKVYMGFDLDAPIQKDTIKYVFLDEFERTSIQYQDALKAYIEEYSAKNVRFILTTNHISKVSAGIRSRMIEINFDCQSADEEKLLKQEIYKRISSKIGPSENFEIPKSDLVKIINRRFPDFRAVLIDVDSWRLTGSVDSGLGNIDLKVRGQLFDMIFDNSTYDQIYHFLMDNFGADGIESIFELLSRPLVDFVLETRSNSTLNLFAANYAVIEHQRLLETAADPIVVAMSLMGKLKSIFGENR